jgi:hypothetical protein
MSSMSVCLDQSQNACDCADPNCTYGDCVTVGPAGATVTANPAVSPSAGASAGAANSVSQMGNVMGQWGATIASIVSGTPAVVNAQGARVGAPAVAPVTSALGSNGLILIAIVGVVVLVLVMKK